MHKYFFAFLLALFSCNTFAQFNDSIIYYAGLNSTGTYNKTNTGELYNSNSTLKFIMSRKSVVMNSISTWVYGKQNSVLTNKDFSSTLDFNLYKTLPRFYYWGLLTYNSSYSLKQNNHLQGGLGIAYDLIDKPNAELNVSDGIMYEYSDVILSEGRHDYYSTFRNSFRLSFKWTIRDIVFLKGAGFFQNSLNYGNDYIIKGDITLGIKIKKWLSLTSALTYNKVTRTRSENLLVTYGLLVERYF